MVTRLHDWDFKLLGPDLGGPISDSEEILEMDGVPLHGIDRSMMLALLVTIAPNALGFLVPVLTVQSISLLGADQELVGMRILVVFKARATVDFAFWVVGVTEDKLFGGGIEGSHVPPQDTAVGRDREEVITLTGLSGPCNIVHRVVMRLFKHGGLNRLNSSFRAADSQIEARDGTVVRSTSNNILDLMMPLHAAQGRVRLKCDLGAVGVIDVPNV